MVVEALVYLDKRGLNNPKLISTFKLGDANRTLAPSTPLKWATLSTYFHYPEYVRKIIYTTNAVEAVHRQFRKLTKTKGGFS